MTAFYTNRCPETLRCPQNVGKTLHYLKEQALGTERQGANRKSKKGGKAEPLPLPPRYLFPDSSAPHLLRPPAAGPEAPTSSFALPGGPGVRVTLACSAKGVPPAVEGAEQGRPGLGATARAFS